MMKYLLIFQLLIGAPAHGALSELDKADVASTNILKNAGFESGKADWSATGGTVTLATSGASLGFGKTSLCWDSGSAGQKLKSALIAIPNSAKSKNGEAYLSIQTPSGSSTHKIRVTDGTSAVSPDLAVSTATSFRKHSVNFPIPTSGSLQIEIEAIASNEPQICLDQGYLGEATNLSQVSQARLIGTAKVTGCDDDWNASTASYTAMGARTSCVYVTTGEVQAPDTMIPGFKVASLAPGEYFIEYEGRIFNASNNTAWFQFTDGTVTAREESTIDGNTTYIPGFKQSFSYTTAQSNVTWQVYGKIGGAALAKVAGTTANPGVFKLFYIPPASQIAVNSLQGDYGRTAYTPTFTGFGSPTGVECFHERKGGNLLLDCKFISGTPTATEARISLPGSLVSAGTSLIPSITVAGNYVRDVAITSVVDTPILIEPSTGYVVFGKQSAGDTPFQKQDGNQVVGAGEFFNFRATIPIAGWTENQRAPTLIGSITSSSSGAIKLESATVDNTNGSSSIVRSSAAWISATSCAGTGNCSYSISGFSVVPTCVCSAGNTALSCSVLSESTSSITIQSYIDNGSITDDTNIKIMCMGPKQ